eukprot:403361038
MGKLQTNTVKMPDPYFFLFYANNVLRLLDDYSIENIKSQRLLSSTKKTQLNFFQFKELISKVKRMLGRVVTNEEYQKIDLASSLVDPLQNPQNSRFKRDIQQNLTSRFKAFENALEISKLKLSTLDNVLKSQQNLNSDQSKKLELLQNQFEDSQKDLSKQIQTIKFVIDSQHLEFKIQRDNVQTQLDTLQLKVQEVNNCAISNNSSGSLVESKQLQNFMMNLQAINQKLNDVIKKVNDQYCDDEELMSYQIYGKELMSFKYRQLVDNEIYKQQTSLLQTQISDYSSKQFKLLYRGSRDSFTASKFHELCDNKGPIVCFILSELGEVFGGYTSLSWASTHQQYTDSSAFLFSLSKKSIHKQYQNENMALIHSKGHMLIFGGGNDIQIVDNCDKNTSSHCVLGYTYEPPNGYEQYSDKARSYLGGQNQFKVLEIEVYSLI